MYLKKNKTTTKKPEKLVFRQLNKVILCKTEKETCFFVFKSHDLKGKWKRCISGGKRALCKCYHKRRANHRRRKTGFNLITSVTGDAHLSALCFVDVFKNIAPILCKTARARRDVFYRTLKVEVSSNYSRPKV